MFNAYDLETVQDTRQIIADSRSGHLIIPIFKTKHEMKILMSYEKFSLERPFR